MMNYKPRQYEGKTFYTPKKDVTKLDTRMKMYEPRNPIASSDNVARKPRTYDTKPPQQIKAKEYGQAKEYKSYGEYVPPWSRGKETYKRQAPPPRKPQPQPTPQPQPQPVKVKVLPTPLAKADSPAQAKSSEVTKTAAVTFAPLPRVVEAGPTSPPATGSIVRTMKLFGV